MVDTRPQTDRFNLRPSLYAAAITLVVLPVILVYSFDIGEILYIVALLPAITLVLLVVAIVMAIRGRWRKSLSIALTLLVCLAISWIVARNGTAIHLEGLWLLHSRREKSQLLAQPAPANGELRHMEWDGWGMFAQDTNVYLVFDPSDSLPAAARRGQPGKFVGIPCKVPRVQRLEAHWYAAVFYTNSSWGECI
jgi:glucan phosphoethanolaminetransferase (alkaline phosphatase superfamily)